MMLFWIENQIILVKLKTSLEYFENITYYKLNFSITSLPASELKFLQHQKTHLDNVWKWRSPTHRRKLSTVSGLLNIKAPISCAWQNGWPFRCLYTIACRFDRSRGVAVYDLEAAKKLHDRAARIFTVTTVEYGSIAPRSQLIFPSRPNISRMIIARPYFTPRIANFEATSTGCCSNLAKLEAPTWKMNHAAECGAVGQLATKALAEVRNDK